MGKGFLIQDLLSSNRELRLNQDRGRTRVHGLKVGANKFDSAHPQNISKSGMFIEVDHVFHPGQNFQFDMKIEGMDVPISGIACVQWQRKEQLGEFLPKGVGVKVVNFFDDSQDRLASFLEEQMLDLRALDMMDGVSFASLSNLPENKISARADLLSICKKFAETSAPSLTVYSDDLKPVGVIQASKIFLFFGEYIRVHGKRLSEQLERSVAQLAHEVQTPLSTIRMAADLLLNQNHALDQREKANMLHMIQNNSFAALNVVENVLEYVNLRSSTQLASMSVTSLSEILQDCFKSFSLAFDRKGILISSNIDEREVFAYCDVQKVIQILNNLLSNALKFCSKGNAVEVKCFDDDQFCYITIADNGPGIESVEQLKLFKDFNKLSNRPTDGERSSGIGLAIAQRLARAQHGEILVKSEKGVGSTFTLKLLRRKTN